MPPTTTDIEHPTDLYETTQHFLEHHGICDEMPPIHSSDWGLVLGNPRAYYFHRRLGLVDILRWSPALSHGSWFHTRSEYMFLPPEIAEARLETKLHERLHELADAAEHVGIQREQLDLIMEREVQSKNEACCWYEALTSVGLPTNEEQQEILNFKDYLSRPYWRVLGHEIKAIYNHPDYPDTPLVAQFDMLLYHTEHNTVWVVDLKTTAFPTIQRLSICPKEFQTQHYLYVLSRLLAENVIQTNFNLPHDVTLGGMLHIAVRKPALKMGGLDRDATLVYHTLTRGPRKGQQEVRREYRGEPTHENYIARCLRWYHCEDEYEGLREGRANDPVVNFSRTSGTYLMDPQYEDEYNSRLEFIHSYATRPAHPGLFPVDISALFSYGKLNRLAPLYLRHQSDWPDLIRSLGLVQKRRDIDLPEGNALL